MPTPLTLALNINRLQRFYPAPMGALEVALTYGKKSMTYGKKSMTYKN